MAQKQATMARPDITLRITRLTVLEALNMSRCVIAGMRNDPHFPEPMIPLDILEQKTDRFQELITEATHGTRQALLQRDAVFADLRDMLTAQAWYVRSCAAGDAVILAGSGFPLRKQPEPIGPLAAPQNLVASYTGRRGTIALKWKPVRGAITYRVWIAIGDILNEENWSEVLIQSRTKVEVQELTSGIHYWFRVDALGTVGFGATSGMAGCMAA